MWSLLRLKEFDKGALKKNVHKMEKGRQTNENILMEQKHHGMRKVRVMNEQRFERTNLTQRGKKLAKTKACNIFAFSLEMNQPCGGCEDSLAMGMHHAETRPVAAWASAEQFTRGRAKVQMASGTLPPGDRWTVENAT